MPWLTISSTVSNCVSDRGCSTRKSRPSACHLKVAIALPSWHRLEDAPIINTVVSPFQVCQQIFEFGGRVVCPAFDARSAFKSSRTTSISVDPPLKINDLCFRSARVRQPSFALARAFPRSGVFPVFVLDPLLNGRVG